MRCNLAPAIFVSRFALRSHVNRCSLDFIIDISNIKNISGLHFHVIGEGVVRVGSGRHERLFDKENYIDFRMRLLGEPGTYMYNSLIACFISKHYKINNCFFTASDMLKLKKYSNRAIIIVHNLKVLFYIFIL